MPNTLNDIPRAARVAARAGACGLGLLLAAPAAVWSGSVASEHVEVRWVPEAETITPGQPFRLGLRMEHAPHWHTYWRNPGDSGFGTSVEWILPEGFTAKPLQFAAPQWIPSQGLISFGYEGPATHVATLQPPANLKPGSTVRLGARVSWLECNEVCIPGGGDLFIDLAVASAPGRTTEAFREVERGLPWTPREWTAHARLDGESLIVSVSVPESGRQPAENMHFFPEAQGLADLPSLAVSETAEGYEIRARLNPAREATPEAVDGLLVGGSPWAGSPGRHAARISAPLSQTGDTDR